MDAAVQPAPSTARTALYAELFERSGGRKLGLTLSEFAATLEHVCSKCLEPGASSEQASGFLRGLRLEELALACACVCGHEAAWTEFLTRYREPLYQAAYGIARDDATGRELADSLYADLYGIKTAETDGAATPRASKLASYTGRGSLEGWLRTVLAQEYVNRYRRQRRLVSLEEQTEAGVQFAASAQAPVAVVDPKVERAIDVALAALDAEGRYLLAAYFLDQRTLAEIGRTLGAHESTISRKLERVCGGLRKQIVRSLRQTGMSQGAAEEALDIDVRDLTVNVRERLRPPPPEAESRKSESRSG